MQYIEHIDYIHPFMNEIDRFYKDTGDWEKEDSSSLFGESTYDKSFESVYQYFKIYGGIDSVFSFSDKQVDPIYPDTYDNNILVCCSGGKDSVACVLNYLEQGYNVKLFFVENINRGYYGELEAVQRVADILGLDLIVDKVKVVGNHCWVEHPLKNWIIANLALTWSISNNFGTNIAFGNYSTSHIYDDPFDVCGGDDIEMWDAYSNVIKRAIPDVKVLIPNESANTTFETLKDRIDLVNASLSCITPFRFRNQFRNRTIKNYNIELMDNRCGCCWKCAVEYIRFADLGVLPLYKEYYLHCIEVLGNTIHKETGEIPYSIENVWNYYILYPIDKSVMYEEVLQYAIIRGYKLKVIKNAFE